MTDLSKLPWNECVLPYFNGQKVHARAAMVGNFAHIEAVEFYPIATQCGDDHNGRWEYRRCTTDELEQILAMCRTVERFIEEHTDNAIGPKGAVCRAIVEAAATVIKAHGCELDHQQIVSKINCEFDKVSRVDGK